jgi:putative N6-adenine-specific DNA methylase
MADFNQKGRVSITCPLGLVPYLKREVENLGYRIRNTRKTGLEVEATLNECVELNYWLRTAHRVHFLISETRADNPDELKKWLSNIPWEEWIPQDGYLSVTSRVDHPSIQNDQFANLTVKDAVVDRIRVKEDSRPDSGSDLQNSVLFLFWNKKTARIFIDTSGESLSRRNYRAKSASAPMQETLAAAIIMETKWEPGQHFINPMTGSGTLAIEAAMQATNRAPASLRNNFGFMHILGFDDEVYQKIRSEARQQVRKDVGGRITASDHDFGAVIAAKKNAKTAGLDHLIELETCDFKDSMVPDGDGVVVFNPPYGERIGEPDELIPLYRKIGDFMKKRCAGKTGYVFTANNKLTKKVGLRASSRTLFFNSTLECRLLEYELYKGSK